MKISDLIYISVKNTVRNKRNSVLSVCAIAIGISAVMLITGIGGSTKEFASQKLDGLGIDGLTLRIDSSGEKLDPAYAKELENRIDGIDKCVPFVYNTAKAEIAKKTNSVISWGVGEDLSYALGLELLHGRDIASSDIIGNHRVAVVDESLALRCYKRSNIVGKVIKLQINGKSDYFEIIGVISSQSAVISTLSGSNMDCFVYIPYSVQNEMNISSGVSQIAVKCTQDANTDAVCAETVSYMEKAHPANGQYCIENISFYLSRVKEIMNSMVILIAAVGTISLVVAGIGVMNGMISGVAQRKHEIGLYMSVGALGRDIVFDILLETMLICITGCACGIVSGLIFSKISADFIGISLAFDIKYVVSVIFICILCSLIFGFVPAVMASGTEPIDALRNN